MQRLSGFSETLSGVQVHKVVKIYTHVLLDCVEHVCISHIGNESEMLVII